MTRLTIFFLLTRLYSFRLTFISFRQNNFSSTGQSSPSDETNEVSSKAETNEVSSKAETNEESSKAETNEASSKAETNEASVKKRYNKKKTLQAFDEIFVKSEASSELIEKSWYSTMPTTTTLAMIRIIISSRFVPEHHSSLRSTFACPLTSTIGTKEDTVRSCSRS
jgi:preprotein translocase subunit SecF